MCAGNMNAFMLPAHIVVTNSSFSFRRTSPEALHMFVTNIIIPCNADSIYTKGVVYKHERAVLRSILYNCIGKLSASKPNHNHFDRLFIRA